MANNIKRKDDDYLKRLAEQIGKETGSAASRSAASASNAAQNVIKRQSVGEIRNNLIKQQNRHNYAAQQADMTAARQNMARATLGATVNTYASRAANNAVQQTLADLRKPKEQTRKAKQDAAAAEAQADLDLRTSVINLDKDRASMRTGEYDNEDVLRAGYANYVTDDYLKYVNDMIAQSEAANAGSGIQDEAHRRRLDWVQKNFGNTNPSVADMLELDVILNGGDIDSAQVAYNLDTATEDARLRAQYDSVMSQISTEEGADAWLRGMAESDTTTNADMDAKAAAQKQLYAWKDYIGGEIDTRAAYNSHAESDLLAGIRGSETYDQDRVFVQPEPAAYNIYANGIDQMYLYVNDMGFRAEYDNKEEQYGNESDFSMKGLQFMDETEIADFNAAYAKSPETAQRYLDSLMATGALNRRRAIYLTTKDIQFAEAHPVLATGKAALVNLANTMSLQPVLQGIGILTGNTDANSAIYDAERTTQALRGKVGEMAGEWWDTPVLGTTAGQLFYGGGNAIIDNRLSLGVARFAGGGYSPKTISGVQQLIQGNQVMGNTFYTELQSGGSPAGALMKGLASAFAAAATEKLSMDQILSDPTNAFMHGMRTVLGESAEEGLENLASIPIDAVVKAITGDKTELDRQYDQLIVQGVDPKTASKAVMINFAQGLASDVLIGGVVGGASGAPNIVSAHIAGGQMQQTGLSDQLLEIAGHMPEDSKSRRMADSVSRTGSKVGTVQLYNTLSEELPRASRDTLDSITVSQISRQLKSAGEKGDTEALARNMLKLGRGETLNANEYAALAESKHGLAELTRLTETSTEDRANLKQYNEAYNAGYYGREASEGMNKAYYQAGVEAAQRAEQKRLARVGKVGIGSGKVSYIGSAMSNADLKTTNAVALDANTFARLEPAQRHAVDALTRISQATGMNFALYEGTADDSGSITVANGKFDHKTNTIYLDLNSGKNSAGQSVVNYAVLRTASHEMTHFIEQNSAEGYAALKNFLTGELAKRGKSIDKLVAQKIAAAERQGEALTQAAATAEVVADACEMMLKDTTAIKRLASENKSLAGKLRDFLRKLGNRIRKALAGVDAEHEEARVLREAGHYIDGLQKLWDDALVEAVQTARSVETKENAIEPSEQFELRAPVEKRNDGLIAVHNLNAAKLMDTLDLGGFPMPSIAVIKAKHGHDMYGAYSVVFGPETIDPEADPANRVYGNDAWTPVFPRIETEVNQDIMYDIETEIEAAAQKVDEEMARKSRGFFGNFDTDVTSKTMDDITASAWNYDGILAAYLVEHGEAVHVLNKEVDAERAYNPARAEQYDKILDIVDVLDYANMPMYELLNTYGDRLAEVSGQMSRLNERWKNDDRRSGMAMARIIKEAIEYEGAGRDTSEKKTTVKDYSATRKAMEDRINRDSFNDWFENKIAKALGNRGIYNGTERYTAMGDRRTFKQTHLEYTVDNVVRAMLKKEESSISASNASGLKAAASTRYGSLDEIRGDSYRLGKVSDEEFTARMAKADNDLRDFFNAIEAWDYDVQEEAGNLLVTASKRKLNAAGIAQLFKANGFKKATLRAAKIAESVIHQVQTIPTGYLEAKPARVVSFDEIRMVIAPDDIPAKLSSALEERGIPYTTYDGTTEDRLEKLNDVEDAQFSRRSITKDPKDQKLTKKQYETFGWVRANEIMSWKAYSELMSKYSSVSRKQASVPRTPDGYFVLWTGKEFGVNQYLVLMKGSISYPVVEQIYEIRFNNETSIGYIRECLLNEIKDLGTIPGGAFYYFDAAGVAGIYKREDSPSYSEYIARYERETRHGISQPRKEWHFGDGDVEDTEVTDSYSLRETNTKDLTREYLENMTPTDRMNETERWLLNKYQSTLAELREKRASIEEQKAIALTAADSNDRIKAQNRAEVLQTQVSRLQKSLQNMEKSDGFGNLMRTTERVIKRFMESENTMHAIDASDTLGAEMADVQKQLQSVAQRLRTAEAGQRAAFARGLFDQKALNTAGNNVRKAFSSSMSGKAIADRLALAYAELYAAEGEDAALRFTQAMRSLAEDVLHSSSNRYRSSVLEDLRENLGGSISLSEAQKQELKNAGISMSQFRRVVGSVVNVSENGSSLSSIVSSAEYYSSGIISQLSSADSEGDMVMKLYELILEEKTKERSVALEGMSEAESLSYTMAEIMQQANFPLTDNAANVEAMREALLEGAERNQSIAAKVDTAIAAAANAKKRASKLWQNIVAVERTAKEAVAYYRALDEQRRLLEEQEIIEHLKSKSAKQLSNLREEKNLAVMSANKIRHIRRAVKTLHDKRVHETDYRNIPEDLKAFVGEVVKIFGDKYGTMVFTQKQADAVHRLYSQLGKSDGPYAEIAPFFDPDMEATLLSLTEWAKEYEAVATGKGMSRLENARRRYLMNEALADLVDHVTAIVRNSTNMFNAGRKLKFAQLSADVKNEMMEREDKEVLLGKPGEALDWIDNLVRTGNITPVYFFEQMGNEAMLNLFRDFQQGQEGYAFELKASQRAIQRIKNQYSYESWKEDPELVMTTSQGHSITMTKEQAMWLYATWKREHSNTIANTEHLTHGGFVYEENADPTGKKFGLRTGRKNTTGHQILPKDMEQVEAYLTQEQKDYADAMVGYLSGPMAEIGNRVSMEMFGIRKYKEKYYFPYKTASDQLYQSSLTGSTTTTDDSRMKHSSFTHALTKHARTALVMGDFTQTVENHIGQMVTYSNFVLPIENMNRVLNHRFETDDGGTSTIRSLIREKYGTNTLKYIETFLHDMNGGLRTDNRTNIGKLVGLHKKAMVAASLSVALQQPSSILRAAAMISPKYIMSAVGSKLDYEQLMQHSGVAIIKQMGRFDTNVGKSTVEWLDESDTKYTYWEMAKQALNPKEWEQFKERWSIITTHLPTKMDEWSWSLLWNAVKREQAAQHPGMDTESDAFLDMCGERFNDVVEHTQVYDSVLSRSQIMRSKSDVDKMITSFMSEPTLTMNILYNAFRNVNKPGGKQKLVGAVASVMASSLAAAIGSALISAWNKDDRTALEKLLNKTQTAFVDNINPLNNLPWISDLWSRLQGYEVERADMSLFSDIVSAMQKVTSDNYTGWRKVEELGGAVANLFGVPAKNIIRDMRRIYNAATSDWSAPTEAGLKAALIPYYDDSVTAFYDRYTASMRNGNTEQAADIAEYLKTVKGKDDDAIRTGVRASVKKQYIAGNMTADEGTAILTGAFPDNYNANNLYWTFDEWDAERNGELEEGQNYSKYLDLYAAIDSGTNVKAEAKRLLDTGVKKSSISTAITEKYKPVLIELYSTDKTAAAQLQSQLLAAYEILGYDRASKLKDIQKWYK